MSRALTASDRSSLIRTASRMPKGSRERRAILSGLAADKTGNQWIDKAIEKPGRLHRYFGIPEEEDIPAGKITEEISKLREKEDRTPEETSLLRALNLAKTLKKF